MTHPTPALRRLLLRRLVANGWKRIGGVWVPPSRQEKAA